MTDIVEHKPASVEPLNRDCFCIGADVSGLHAWLQHDLARRGLGRPLVDTHPHLFSALPTGRPSVEEGWKSAAAELGISRKTLREKVRKLGIQSPRAE